jgi:hypothetical protein
VSWPSTSRDPLIKHGVHRRRSNLKREATSPWDPQQRATAAGEAAALYASGMSMPYIARELDGSYAIIHGLLSDSGVRLRPRGRR